MREHGLDAGVAFDGDADRCLMVDENGNEVDGDMLMAICALDMKSRGKLNKNTVVGTIMTNLGFIKFCEREGIRFIATKVGDRFVMEEMLLEEYSFGGEQSGHLIFRDFATTGDGELTAIQVLSLMRARGPQALGAGLGDDALPAGDDQRARLRGRQAALLHRPRSQARHRRSQARTGQGGPHRGAHLRHGAAHPRHGRGTWTTARIRAVAERVAGVVRERLGE